MITINSALYHTITAHLGGLIDGFTLFRNNLPTTIFCISFDTKAF